MGSSPTRRYASGGRGMVPLPPQGEQTQDVLPRSLLCHSDRTQRSKKSLLASSVGGTARGISPNGTLWNIDSTVDQPQSALMLRARITLPHFSVSSAIILPKSAGEPASTVPPRSARWAFILGSSRAALISLLSLRIVCGDVFLGAPTPY